MKRSGRKMCFKAKSDAHYSQGYCKRDKRQTDRCRQPKICLSMSQAAS